jgi:hypothetical protein
MLHGSPPSGGQSYVTHRYENVNYSNLNTLEVWNALSRGLIFGVPGGV